jgi:SAM-dependent methyltransferase
VSLDRHRQDWDRLAETDALWAVLTEPGTKGGRWDVDAFFATGEAEIAQVLRVARSHDRPSGRARALDFGCGVGRLTRALAGRFDTVVGVDVSSAMIEQAQQHNAAHPGCEFRVNGDGDLRQFDAGTFDFVYSNIVLQHLRSVPEITGYLGELLRVTRPDGLVVFGLANRVPFPYSLEVRRRVYAVLRRLGVSESWMLRRTSLTPMRMTWVPHDEVLRFLRDRGARLLEVETADSGVAPGRRYYASPV